ncbi:arabinofuranosidase catalytic domain-containing protein [Streptomyces griseofuscus]|uniref:arabinofuranosidase catalytic domain-containing protein n=1 Tax=Streptomyces griseofuscus TaxID=146922 RepID=UPI0005616491|nr:arabinofuranosidase catalytic domain-containing protein [Streptomyces griseofuscus]
MAGIILGTGGDNSNWNRGTFFEGVMVSGHPSDAAENAVQADIVSVGYAGGTDVPNGSQGTVTGPGGKCVDAAADDTGANGTAAQLWDCHLGRGPALAAQRRRLPEHHRPLPGHRGERHRQRHRGRTVGLQRRRRSEVGAAG